MLTNNKGFTLIEFITVLIILGILAVMALPRYFSLVDEARRNAGLAAVAEVKSRANQYYALRILETGVPPAAAAVLASVTVTPDVGEDFSVAAAASGSDIVITVNSVKGIAVTGVAGTWIYPTR